MKESILKLRAEGLTYQQISSKLQCSKSLVSYYCGDNQKQKSKLRSQNRWNRLIIGRKVDKFQRTRTSQYNRKLKDKTEDFQRLRYRTDQGRRLGKRKLLFTCSDVIRKFGRYTNCYLTGRPIDLNKPETYHFDHIVPYSRGGTNTLDNLGITCKEANKAKDVLPVDEFLNLCKEILEHNGYRVEKVSS
jgi:5-methylcytosine-specific restriction endonuclease McrA